MELYKLAEGGMCSVAVALDKQRDNRKVVLKSFKADHGEGAAGGAATGRRVQAAAEPWPCNDDFDDDTDAVLADGSRWWTLAIINR